MDNFPMSSLNKIKCWYTEEEFLFAFLKALVSVLNRILSIKPSDHLSWIFVEAMLPESIELKCVFITFCTSFNSRQSYCNNIEAIEQIYTELDNVRQLWQNTENWDKLVYNPYFKISETEKIFGEKYNNYVTSNTWSSCYVWCFIS